MNQLRRIPRSLTAPDAWIAIILASYLQYKQYIRRKQTVKGKVHAGAKEKPKAQRVWSLVHEWLFTNLHMMVSPFKNQASDLNAEMVDLQSEKELHSYAKKVAEGKTPKKKSGGGGKNRKSMEIRTRRIIRGEFVHNAYYPLLESSLNLAMALVVGIASRWGFGLFRSLKLSVNEGVCCSPYRGSDDEGSRLLGSFERLLACVLIKQEGDNAGTFLFTLFLLVLLTGIVRLAWFVSSPSTTKDDDLGVGHIDNEDGDRKEKGTQTFRQTNPMKVKQFILFICTSLFTFWLFQTPALLNMLGLDGLTEAAEEWAARVILFGNLLGFISTPNTATLEESVEALQNLMTIFLLVLAVLWGYIASGMQTPIKETARNAAHILSPSPSKKGGKNPSEMLDLINVRLMLIIQAMAPFMIMCTYLVSTRFSEALKAPGRGGQMNMTFSKQYLRNSGLVVRVALSWCFVVVSSYTFRSLLQSYLDQAASMVSSMSTLGPSTSQESPKVDPFNGRYKNMVRMAGQVAVFPLFVLVILATAHLRGGDGTVHPGVGYKSQPKVAPRSVLHAQGLPAPFSEKYMSWIVDRKEKQKGEAGGGNALLQVAALSQHSWDITPVRDSAHKKITALFSGFCYPPEDRSIKALGRHVNFLLDDRGDSTDKRSLLTQNALTGGELLYMAPLVPTTFADILFSREANFEGNCKPDEIRSEEGSNDIQREEECRVSEDGTPNLFEMCSSLVSHNFLTPTVVFPIIDTVAFLASIWWTYWYSIMMIWYWIKLRKTASIGLSE